MAMFGLNQTEIRNGYAAAAAQPYDSMRDSAPGFFEGSFDSIGSGFKEGVGGLMLLDFDVQRRFNREYSDDDEQLRLGLIDEMKAIRPDPQTTGFLGNIFHGLTSAVSQFAAGAIVGGMPGAAILAGTAQGNMERNRLISEGVDPDTALKVGATTGVATGLGGVTPAAIPGSLLKRTTSGAAINTIMGMTERGASGAILEANGYKDMADQYRVLDWAGIFTDAILGGGFGAIGEGGRARIAPLPSEIDAALAANMLHKLEIDAAPGIAADIATRNAHIGRMDTALWQLVRGEPVNIADIAPDMNFLPKPEAPHIFAGMDAAIKEHGLPEVAKRAETRMAKLERELDSGVSEPRRAEILKEMDTLAEEASAAYTAKTKPKGKPAKPLQEKGAPAKGAKQAAEEADPIITAAETIAAEKPDIQLMDDNGEVLSAGDALVRADEAVVKADEDAKLIDAAITCFLRAGDEN